MPDVSNDDEENQSLFSFLFKEMLFSGPKQMELEETVERLMEPVERFEKRYGQDLTRVEASSELRRLKFTLIKMWKDGERDLVETEIIDYCIVSFCFTL